MSEVLAKRELPTGLIFTSTAPLVLTLVGLIPSIRGMWIAFNAPFRYMTGVSYYGFIGYSWFFVILGLVFFTFLVYMITKFGLVYLPLESNTRNHMLIGLSFIFTLVSLGLAAAGWDLCDDVRGLGINSLLLGFGILLYALTCIVLVMHVLMLLVNYRRFTSRT